MTSAGARGPVVAVTGLTMAWVLAACGSDGADDPPSGDGAVAASADDDTDQGAAAEADDGDTEAEDDGIPLPTRHELQPDELACTAVGTFQNDEDPAAYVVDEDLPFVDAWSRAAVGGRGPLVQYTMIAWDGDAGWRAQFVRFQDAPTEDRIELSRFTALVGGADTATAYSWIYPPGDDVVDDLAFDGSGGRLAASADGVTSVAWDVTFTCS